MAEKKIVINVSQDGNIDAETFGEFGTSCIDELDKLLKDIALQGEYAKKDEFYSQGTSTSSRIVNKRD